ncbi:unnamed protein product, partial [Heligmosomoides polygyrus]|uniref:Uncharacterized protein n=1 Tax=Heligmosomoides polygyrus TaxID=6339 RepID=A0A183F672_HELPZ
MTGFQLERSTKPFPKADLSLGWVPCSRADTTSTGKTPLAFAEQGVKITLSRDFAFAFLAYGPLREREEGLGLMVLFCIAFVSSMVLVTDSFIYRYLQFC